MIAPATAETLEGVDVDVDVDVERKQAQAIASLPDSIAHYYAYGTLMKILL